MSDVGERRRALIERFRASAATRLGKVTLALVDLESGAATSDGLQGVLRELHTIKGEAKMLDFPRLSETVHVVEERLLAVGALDGLDARITATAVLDVVDVATRWLRGELGQDAGADGALTTARDSLRAGTPLPDRPASIAAPALFPGAPRAQQGTTSASPEPRPASPPTAQRWVSVNAQQVDGLCDLLSEFDGAFRALNLKVREEARALAKGETRAPLARRESRELVAEFERCRLQLDELTGWAWGLRLVPMEPLLADLVAHARSLASAQGKRLAVRVDGGRVQVERSILDVLGEPLLHLVRNAVDHGIEPPHVRASLGKAPASLVIRAESSGPNVVLVIEDDGRGIDRGAVRAAAVSAGLISSEAARALGDPEVLALTFLHGFSTRKEVSDLSGRGVGLDVVRSRVEAVGGRVSLTSDVGAGTRFEVTIPSTISKERNLVIEASDGLYAVPSRFVAGLLRVQDFAVDGGARVRELVHEGRTLPLFSLVATLGLPEDQGEPIAVVLDPSAGESAFTVPKVLGEFSLLRRPIDRVVGATSLIAASSTFEDGRLILVLSPPALERQRRASTEREAVPASPRVKVLAVDDSAIVRDLLVEVLGHAGFEVRVATDGPSGLAAVARQRPDVVVLDVDMPGMDGFEALRRLRAGGSPPPVIMLTTRASAEDRGRASALGASAFLVKAQFDEAAIVETVRGLARR